MLDFMTISTKTNKNSVDISPKFKMMKSKDLMIRGRDFYAIWDEERKIWSTDEDDVTRLVDRELDRYVSENESRLEGTPIIKYMWDSDSGSIDKFHKYCQKQMRDNYKMLDENLIFSNTDLSRENYSSKRLPYPLEPGDISAWDKLIGTLYSEDERHKIEWAIGSVVSGESKILQKFLVFYGAGGTGKSTIINIIEKLFEGYCCSFDAKALGNPNNAFALEPFKNNPLVAIQHDGDLSKIEDNTRLNSVISHEPMSMNEKFKGQYETKFNCFLFMGTNTPVKITDAKSGLLRRLIDVHPTEKLLPQKEYKTLIAQIDFELGAIAHHCLEVFREDPEYYDTYRPKDMLMASNDFYNFVCDSFSIFKKEDGTTLKAAWEMYKNYCEEAKVPYPLPMRKFKDELKNYFFKFDDNLEKEDGSRLVRYYSGFKIDNFKDSIGGKKNERKEEAINDKNTLWLQMEQQASLFDSVCATCPAQYATTKETPTKPWDNVTTKLSELDTSKLHYVKVPENHVVIDFDLKDESGNKSFEKNLEAAIKWPPTYAELSKGGQGIHLHYIYNGDVSELSRIFDEDIEIKIFTGKSSLRRRLSRCNNLDIRTISSGLPLKEVKNVINFDGIKNEKYLRSILKKHLNKEIMGNTAPSIQMIKKLLDEAYSSGIGYDVTDMKNAVFALAASSSNQANECIKLVGQMQFKSEELGVTISDNDTLVFYDCEVFPNLFLVNYKMAGEGNPIVRLINPKPYQIEELIRFKLVGFNCRKYDNHMIYACMMGYDNLQLYKLSQDIIMEKKGFFGEAYNLSYTDIYDFASAGNKKSLKKLEIEMGIHHQELGLPWDKPVPENLWYKVAEYCDNDVIATEAAFHYLKGDWIARQILADIAGMTVNDTTNTLSQRIIFGNNKHPQNEFNYRDLSKPVGSDQYDEYVDKFGYDYNFRVFNDRGLPEYRSYTPGEQLPKGWSILPFFPEYDFDPFRPVKSIYLGEEIGEGGRVYAEPGIYSKVWDGDVTGMHPSTIIAEMLFGPRYTKAFKEIVDGRVSIKHQAWSDIDNLFGGKLKPYIQKVTNGELTAKELANALKTVVNSVYGLTSASFENACRDVRNRDNIVAKRGALFMTLLTKEVQKKGFVVCHNKTDSIKIPNATPEIEEFVIKFGKEYGYSFETEARFSKFCLVNDAVYVAKTEEGKWIATGKQFAVPYVFKTLFSKNPIVFDDMCETFAVSKGDLYLDMNECLPDVSDFEKELKKLENNYKKGKLSDVSFESACEGLPEKIAEGHDYHFVGRVGRFCPIKSGCGGGVLYRMNEGKYYAAPGSTGYRWLESELIKDNNEDIIDRSFYNKLVDDAIDTISKYGDFEWLVSDDANNDDTLKLKMSDFMNIPEDAPEEIPFEEALPWG